MASLSQCQPLDIAADDSASSEAKAGEQTEQAMPRASLECLSLDALVQEAQQEVHRFRQKQPTTGMASFEVFRRALLLRDEAAGEGLYQLYVPLVEAWLLLHSRGRVLEAEELAGLVNEILAKFARALPAQKWSSFATTPSLVAYLKCCATSVTADSWRQQQRWEREDPAETVMNRQSSRDLWQAAASFTQDEAERLILYQHYQQGFRYASFRPATRTCFPPSRSSTTASRPCCEGCVGTRPCSKQPVSRQPLLRKESYDDFRTTSIA